MSVRDLVRPQLGLEDDPCSSCSARPRVEAGSDAVGLLDSLLAGYPIGSLLLCRVQQDTDARNSAQPKVRRDGWLVNAAIGRWSARIRVVVHLH